MFAARSPAHYAQRQAEVNHLSVVFKFKRRDISVEEYLCGLDIRRVECTVHDVAGPQPRATKYFTIASQPHHAGVVHLVLVGAVLF
jgi:hypothetical protein